MHVKKSYICLRSGMINEIMFVHRFTDALLSVALFSIDLKDVDVNLSAPKSLSPVAALFSHAT